MTPKWRYMRAFAARRLLPRVQSARIPSLTFCVCRQMVMESEDWVALGGFVTICASALALVVKQLESSRCTEIDSCCIRCKRKVTDPDESPGAP